MLKRSIVTASLISAVCLAIGFPVCRGRHISRKLLEAVSQNNDSLVRTLLDKGANVNISDPSFGFTPLHLAAMRGQADLVKTLLGKGADVEAATKDCGSTPLHLAMARNYDPKYGSVCADTKIAEHLLAYGADANARNKYGFTPLLITCLEQCPDLARVLLDYGADINMRTKYGSTLLHGACAVGNTNIVELLLDYDIDVNAVDKEGNTALDLSLKKGCVDIVEVLIKHGAGTSAEIKQVSSF